MTTSYDDEAVQLERALDDVVRESGKLEAVLNDVPEVGRYHASMAASVLIKACVHAGMAECNGDVVLGNMACARMLSNIRIQLEVK